LRSGSQGGGADGGKSTGVYLPAYYGQLGAPVAPPQAGSMRIVSVSLACNSGGTIHCYVQLALDRCLGGHPRRRQQVAEILDNKWTQNAGKRCGGGGSEGARKIESIIKKLRLAGAVWASCRLLCETAARKSLGGNLRERKTSWNEKFESRQTTTGQRSPSYCSIRNASHADTHRHRQAHTDTDRHTHTHTHTHTAPPPLHMQTTVPHKWLLSLYLSPSPSPTWQGHEWHLMHSS